MRPLTDSDLDFFSNCMPEWCGETPEKGRKAAAEWRRLRSKEEHERKVAELTQAVNQRIAAKQKGCKE